MIGHLSELESRFFLAVNEFLVIKVDQKPQLARDLRRECRLR